MFTIVQSLKITFSCFKQPPLNFLLSLVPTKFTEGLSVLLDAVGGLILSSDNPVDFHDKI